MIAWTMVYNAFTMGGSVWRPSGFEFKEGDAVHLGKGFYGYVLESPNGKTIVVEKQSGAIVGNSLEEVVSDIAEAEFETMQKQVEHACSKNINLVSEEKFWLLYDKNK